MFSFTSAKYPLHHIINKGSTYVQSNTDFTATISEYGRHPKLEYP